MKGLVLAACFAFALMLFFGCIGYEKTPLPGSDRDEHGCIGSAGYSWCEPLQQCIRPWETNCTNQVLKYNAGPEGQQPINASQIDDGIKGLGDDIKIVPSDAVPSDKIAPFPNNTATIGGICHDEVVEAWCSADTYVSYQVLNAEGMPTGYARVVVSLYNNENVTANCTVQFVRIPEGGTEQFTNFTAVLGPHETSQNFTLTSPNSDAGREEFFGSMVQKVCKPYPGN